LKLNKIVKYAIENPDECNRYSYPYRNLDYIEMENKNIINILKKFVTILNDNDMSLLLNLAYKKDYKNFLNFISREPIENNKILDNIDENYNLLYNCLFVVKDLKNFLKKITVSTNLPVNAGPQKQRGVVNSMSSFLSSVDDHYRDSLFQHHKLHYPGYDSGLALTRNEFSYINIHMNLGNIR
jgi:hypothetical protein